MNTYEAEVTAEMEAYYLKPYQVVCRCGREAKMPEANLKQAGWRLSPLHADTELCPACFAEQVIWEAAVAVGRAQKLCDQLDRLGPVKLTKKQMREPCPF
jgi:hypothetical protein